MVLPLLGGLAGTALAGTGALGTLGIGAGLASAIGSGLGSLAQGDSIEDAIGAGAMNYMTGGMLGGAAEKIMGVGDAARSAVAAETGRQAAGAGGQMVKDAMQGAAGQSQGIMGGAKDFLSRPGVLRGGIGALGGAASVYQPKGGPGKGGKEEYVPEARAPGGPRWARGRRMGPGELDYGFRTNYGYQDGGMVQPGMAMRAEERYGPMSQGGLRDVAMQQDAQMRAPQPPEDEKGVINEAVAAIEGRHPQPEIALARYTQLYGPDALRELVSSVRRGDMDRNRTQADNFVYGPETGGDAVPATVVDESGVPAEDVLLEAGEYVVPKEATANIGPENLDRLSQQAMA